MVGSNQLTLNAATLSQALQEWLDKRWVAPSPRVTGVTASGDSFFVIVESPEASKSADGTPEG
jgi:hypothetical protein